MRKSLGFRLLSIGMVLAILLPTMALADIITTYGEFVEYFTSIEDGAQSDGKIRITDEREAQYISGGWYLVNAAAGRVYVRASSVTNVNATPVPIETSVTAQVTQTNALATPTPAVVGGVKDATYEGTVISFTVPAGGLSLYNRGDGTGSVVEIAKANTTLKLTQVTTQEQINDPDNPAKEIWFSLYYNGTTYFVPQSALNNAPVVSADATPSPYQENMWRINIRSLMIGSTANLYTGYTLYDYTRAGSAGRFDDYTKALTGKTDNQLVAGTRVNVNYVGVYLVENVDRGYLIYSYVLNGRTYYFSGEHVRSGSESTASVVSNDDVSLMSIIPVAADAKLYTTQVKSDSSLHYQLDTAQNLYGVKINSEWYKVMYGPEVFFLYYTDIAGDITQVASNDTASLGTYRVVAGSKGATLYTSTRMGYSGGSGTIGTYGPLDSSGKKLSAGESALASPYDAIWYKYTIFDTDKNTQTTYYLYRQELADYVDTSSMTGYKVFFNLGTSLYSKANEASWTSLSIPKSDYYTVQNYNDIWYSIVYDNLTYYIRKSDVVTVGTSSFMVKVNDPITIYENSAGGGSDTLPKGQYAVKQATVNHRGDGLDPSNCYLFIRGSVEYLINISDVSGRGSISTEKFVITIGATSQQIYMYLNEPGDQSWTPIAPANPSSYLVSQLQENFRDNVYAASECYSYMYGGQEYIILKDDVNEHGDIPTDSYVYTLNNPVTMYENVPGGQAQTLAADTYVFTQATENNYSSDNPSNYYAYHDGVSEYLIRKTDLTGNGYYTELTESVERFAVTTTGSTYYVTIGAEGAMLFSESTCTEDPVGYLQPGESVYATKFTSSLYIVNNAGNKMYLPVRYIATVRGGDDASIYDTNTDSNISDIVKGETDTTYKGTVLSYTVPAGGLWLHYTPHTASDGKVLNAGNTVKLSTAYDADGKTPIEGWYTTWYGGTQYYVSKASLTVIQTNMNFSSGYSIVLARNVKLYTNTAFTNYAEGSTYRNQYLSNIELTAGTRVNVRVAMKANTTDYTTTTVTVYSYTHFDGKTYYFPARETAGENVKIDDILLATVSSNSDTSLVTKFTLTKNVALYAKPDIGSRYITVSNMTASGGTQVLYGISYDNTWYRVIYDDTAWYMLKSGFSGTSEQLTVSSGATSTTFSVVIASGGARLYTAPQTNTYRMTTTTGGQTTVIHEIGEQNWYKGRVLPGGSTVSASQYNSLWYTLAYNDPDTDDGVILYFQNTGAANSSSTSAIRSYQIILKHAAGASKIVINLYNTIAENAPVIRTKELVSTLDGVIYTLRMLDKTWSSIIIDGRTYYIRNSSIPDDIMNASTPIASTSVGNTYTITIGGKYFDNKNDKHIPVNASSALTGTIIGNIALGTRTSGTLLYIEGAKGKTQNGLGLVYQISLNGVKGYIDASYVSGIVSGDEVSEAAQAEQQATTDTAIGTTVMETLNAGTLLYAEQNTTSSTISLGSSTVFQLTKINATWYSVPYSGQTRYVLASVVEKTSGTTVVAVGETISITLTDAALLYDEPEDYASVVDVMLIGETFRFTKISDKWYEVNYNGEDRYAKVADITLPKVATTTPTIPTNQTTDGTGIITANVLISPESGTVNLRQSASASSSSAVLARIPKGTTVKNNSYFVDSNGQIWYNVTYNGITGYVLGTYVTAVGTADDSAVVTLDPTQDIGKVLTINVSEVNIRSNAGTNYSIIGKLQKGSTIVPTSVTTGTDGLYWYKFNFSSTTIGYIRYDYLSGGTVSADMTGNVAIKAGDTNIRSGAGSNFGVKAKLPKDTIVTIVGSGTDSSDQLWYRVTVNNLNGYVRADLVRPLTTAESSGLLSSIVSQYTQLNYGDKGANVLALQQQLISTGYLSAGDADGVYGNKTTDAIKRFQAAKGLTANGVATAATQAALFNTTVVSSGSTQALDWFTTGYSLINKNPNVQIYDINSGITWNAKYINGANHADVIPASSADAAKLTANNIVGSYVRRPVIVTISGAKYAGSMYAVGHGTTSYCSYFSGVMCIHFTGSKTHGTGNVDADHQAAINTALTYNN